MNEIEKYSERLSDKLVEINHFIYEYEYIFNEDKETQEIIKKTGSRFFNDIYRLYWTFFITRICALMEKPETFKQKNLSVQGLIELVDKSEFKCFNEVNLIRNQILEILKPFNKARNKAYGHFDLVAMTADDIISITLLDDLIDVCSLIRDILNKINLELGLNINISIRSIDGAKRIIQILKEGVETNS